MKKIKFFCLLFVITVVFSGCATTFDGYYYDLEKARCSENNIYNQYDWLYSTTLEPKQYRWCIVEKLYNEQNLNIEAFEFAYQDTSVHLCYEMISE